MKIYDYVQTLVLQIYDLDSPNPTCAARVKNKNKYLHIRYHYLHYLNDKFECIHSGDNICISNAVGKCNPKHI